MSAEATRLVWAASKCGGVQLLALLAMADESPSRIAPFLVSIGAAELGEKMRCQESNARKIIAQLLETGEIKLHHKGGGKGIANAYEIKLWKPKHPRKVF